MFRHAEAVNPLSEKVRRATKAALHDLGTEYRDKLREVVGKNVGHKGKRVIRSRPGEPPRKEYGTYQKSIKFRVRSSGKREVLTIDSDDVRAVWFELGTRRMLPRPHWSKIKREASTLHRKFKQYFKQHYEGA